MTIILLPEECNYWRPIALLLRNRLAHGYFELDAELVLDAVRNGIPPLQTAIIRAIEICK